MRICALQIFASLALACIPMDRVATAEDRRSHATTADKPAFVIGGVGYFHRWSQNDQHEFTPTGQDDLEKWSDMITISVYPTAHDGDALAVRANAVLENYKSHGGRVLRTDSVPRTPDRPAEHFNGPKMEKMLMDWNNSPSPASLRGLPRKQACVGGSNRFAVK
jgi:hypothetical protein